jgi:hypothetical protein
MSQLDEVLERLIVEPEFKRAVADDPATALAAYRLTADELELLGTQLDVSSGLSGGIEDRQSKSALFGLLAQAVDLLSVEPPDFGDLGPHRGPRQ